MASTSVAIQAGHCPKCGSGEYRTVKYTWWGGLFGPKLFSHVVCLGCKTGFNSKTGKPNAVPVAIYTGVTVVLAVGVIVAFLALER